MHGLIKVTREKLLEDVLLVNKASEVPKVLWKQLFDYRVNGSNG